MDNLNAFAVGSWSEYWAARLVADWLPNSIIFSALNLAENPRLIRFDNVPPCQQRNRIREKIDQLNVGRVWFSGCSPFVFSSLVALAGGERKVERVYFEALLPASAYEFYRNSTLEISADLILAASSPALERFQKIRPDARVVFTGSIFEDLAALCPASRSEGRTKNKTFITSQKIQPGALENIVPLIGPGEPITTDDFQIQRWAALTGRPVRAFVGSALKEIRDKTGDRIFSQFIEPSELLGIFKPDPAKRVYTEIIEAVN